MLLPILILALLVSNLITVSLYKRKLMKKVEKLEKDTEEQLQLCVNKNKKKMFELGQNYLAGINTVKRVIYGENVNTYFGSN